jgi:hypothetical protein
MNMDLSNIRYLAIEVHIQLGEKAIELIDYLNKFFVVISEIGDGINTHKEFTLKNKNNF